MELKQHKIRLMVIKNILILLLLFITLAYFAPVLFTDKTFIARDNYIFYNPRQFFAAETIRSGFLPLWNPYIACGVPFQANLQNSLFYPFSILYYMLPFQTGFKYYIVLHYFLGALFMFLLVRTWRGSRYAAFLAGVIFAFGGYLVSINDNVAFLTAAIWLPLIMVCHHHSLKSGSFSYSIVTGIVVAAQIFAGDASFYLLSTFICTILYTLFWPYLENNSENSRLPKPFLQLATSWIIALALAAVQLVPFVEFVIHSPRFKGLSFEQVTKWSFHPLELLQFLVPYIFGSNVPETRWFGQQWLDTTYIGIFPLILVIIFAVYNKCRVKAFLTTLLFVSLFLSIGKYNPLFLYLYKFIPGISMLQYPVKFLFLAGFSLAIMAGMGADSFCDLINKKDLLRKFMKRFLIVPGVLTVCLITGSFFNNDLLSCFLKTYPHSEYLTPVADAAYLSIFKGASAALILLSLFVALLWAVYRQKINRNFALTLIACIACMDLYCMGKPNDPYVSQTLPHEENKTTRFLQLDQSVFRIYSLAQFQSKRSFLHVHYMPFDRVYRILREAMQANLNMYDHVFSAEEYSDLLNNDFYDIFFPVEQSFLQGDMSPERIAYCKKIFSLLNVKYIISPFAASYLGFDLVSDGPIKIYRNSSALPRAFFAESLVVLKNEDDVLAAITENSYNPQTVVYISKEESQKIKNELALLQQALDAAPFHGTVDRIEYRPNKVTLHAASDRPGFLVLSDTYYPGWKAFDNGKQVPLVKTNHALRGIFVDKGDHEIVFLFRPVTFIAGSVITLIALSGIGLLALINYRHFLKTRQQARESL